MTPKFIIQKSKDGANYFTLQARNGEIIAVSELYNSKQACYKGVHAVIDAARKAEIVEKYIRPELETVNPKL